MLDERKILVLQAIIDDYISSAEPVGSRTIARRYNLGVSPATIRNEMADLEETGYILQPHISAGRIPSDKGYRFYVDVLMEPRRISDQRRSEIRHRIAQHSQEIELLVQETARMLSLLTNYVAVVVAPQVNNCVIEQIRLLPLDEERVIFVLVLYPGMVQNRIIRLEKKYDADSMNQISQQLTNKLRGISYRDIKSTLIKEIEAEHGELGTAILEIVLSELANKNEQVYFNGAIRIFEQPEFKDVDRVKGLLSLLEEKDELSQLISRLSNITGVQIGIGQENPLIGIHDCSVVSCAYSVGSEVIGAIGVIGPTRMEYAKVYSVVELLANSLSEVLTDIIK